MYRQKPFQLKLRKDQYVSHLKKLQEITTFNSNYHKSLKKQRLDMSNLIKKSHQKHNKSLKEEFKRREKVEQETHRINYDNVKSIIKRQLDRKILNVPDKQKATTQFLDISNLKLADQLIHVKSQFNFKKDSARYLSRKTTKREVKVNHQDFTPILNHSRIYPEKKKKIKLKINSPDDKVKVQLKFLDHSHLFSLKSDSLFAIILSNETNKIRSKLHAFDELLNSEINLLVPQKSCTVTFAQNLRQKDVPRFKIELSEEDLNSNETTWVTKPIQDTKNRAIGVVELQLKKKRILIARSTHCSPKGQKNSENLTEAVQKSPQIMTPTFTIS